MTDPATREADRHAVLGLSLAGVAGVLALMGVATLVAAGIMAMSLVLPGWAAGLVAAGSLFTAAALVAVAAHHQVVEHDESPATVEPLGERLLGSVPDAIAEVTGLGAQGRTA